MKNIVRLRKVQETDAHFLWALANDSEVRAASFSPNAIPWEEHLAWLKERLKDPSCIFFILQKDDAAIGQVRFDKTNKEAVISISIEKAYRGKGLATHSIKISTWQIFKTTEIMTIHAYVKADNTASVSAFLRADFNDCGKALVKGNKSIHLIKERQENGSTD